MLRHQRGVSLVETMVVIAILGILLAVAGPNLADWIASNRIRFSAESLLSGVSLARTNALKRGARVFFTFGTDSSWTIGCVDEVTADHDGDGNADCPATIEQKGRREISGAVLTATPTGANTITYSSIGRLVPNSDASSSITQIDFTSNNTSTVWRLMVSGTGQARVCNPGLSAGQSNACS